MSSPVERHLFLVFLLMYNHKASLFSPFIHSLSSIIINYLKFFPFPPSPHFILSLPSDLLLVTLTCPPSSFCYMSTGRQSPLPPSLSTAQLNQTGEGMDGGGCHGNWESVAARHHLLLHGAERVHEYLSFMDTDRQMTQTALWTSNVTEDGNTERSLKRETREGRERMGGWRKGGDTEGD